MRRARVDECGAAGAANNCERCSLLIIVMERVDVTRRGGAGRVPMRDVRGVGGVRTHTSTGGVECVQTGVCAAYIGRI